MQCLESAQFLHYFRWRNIVCHVIVCTTLNVQLPPHIIAVTGPSWHLTSCALVNIPGSLYNTVRNTTFVSPVVCLCWGWKIWFPSLPIKKLSEHTVHTRPWTQQHYKPRVWQPFVCLFNAGNCAMGGSNARSVIQHIAAYISRPQLTEQMEWTLHLLVPYKCGHSTQAGLVAGRAILPSWQST